MPKLGFDMAEGTLVRWVVVEGQPVTKGGVLAEIETDKATVEVESVYEGVVLKHLVTEGTVVPVNTPIAVIGAAGESVDVSALGVQAAAPPAVEAAEEKTPPAEAAATTTQVQVDEGEMEGTLPGGVRASPVARRLAMEREVDLRQVKGSGPAGRIVKADIESFLAAPAPVTAPPAITPTPTQPEAAPKAPAGAPTVPLPALAPVVFEPRPDVRVSLSRLRQAIGRRMTEVKQQVPHFYVSHEYDMKAVIDLRKQVNALLPEAEKISVNDFVVKAVALALRTFPNLNATVDTQKNEVIQYGHVNIGVAVAVENGLLTVVCRDADMKPLRLIGSEVKTMATKARQGKVRPDDIEGSTFSISNLGMYDVEDFIAIINPPEAAILAVGSAREVPVVVDGEVKPGVRMKATISVDHRVSDGAEAARFMQFLAQYLEQPLRLMV
jgi:pyruvate dehydrogenase E2 component (dihydrolipoamide acetyltransferase)